MLRRPSKWTNYTVYSFRVEKLGYSKPPKPPLPRPPITFERNAFVLWRMPNIDGHYGTGAPKGGTCGTDKNNQNRDEKDRLKWEENNELLQCYHLQVLRRGGGVHKISRTTCERTQLQSLSLFVSKSNIFLCRISSYLLAHCLHF